VHKGTVTASQSRIVFKLPEYDPMLKIVLKMGKPSREEAVQESMIGLVAQPLVLDRTELDLLQDFSAWMTSEQRRVYSLCQRFLQDRDEADSATQDVFLKAFQALKRTDQKELEDPARWVTRIAVNTCLDRLRSRKWQLWRRRPSSADEQIILSMTASTRPEAEERYFAEQISARLSVALEKLSPRQRAVFTLRHFEDLSMEEIGSILNLDVGTVKAHMFRAINKLRGDLKDLYGVRSKK
jgi:RNA polymerase sigma-70 factor (ECF subfamily)